MQRITSAVTALVVFITSINCVCRGGLVTPRHSHGEQMAAACPHCGGPAKGVDDGGCSSCKHENSGHHDPAVCIHCQGTLVSESNTSHYCSHALALSFDLPLWDVQALSGLTADLRPRSRYFSNDLSPPLDSPTLLNLNCSLNT
jgi:hypothetical protein